MPIPLWRYLLSGFLALLILLGLAGLGAAIYLRDNLGSVIECLAHDQGLPLQIKSVVWKSFHSFEISNLVVGNEGKAAQVQTILMDWEWWTLLTKHRVRELQIHSPSLWSRELGLLAQSLDRETTDTHSQSWLVDHVLISNGVMNLDDIRPGLPNIQVQLGHGRPIEFTHLPLGSDLRAYGELPQEAVAEDVVIASPQDPLTKVLHFETIKLHFSWAALARRELTEVELIAPTVYLGPDLFWFADQFQSQSEPEKNPHLVMDEESWKIDHLTLRGGQLVVSAFGEPGVQLPFIFEAEAPNLRLDRIQDLSLKSQIKIIPQQIDYPSYQISLELKEGRIEFNLPPSQNTEHNLVQTIHFKRVSWREIEATEAWSSFTFNQQGIFGQLGGKAYNGYLNGEFAVRFAAGYPWEASAYVTHVEAGPIVEKMTRQRFAMSLTGRATGKISVKAQGTTILSTTADLKLLPPGELHLIELQPLIDSMPATWGQAQRAIASSALASFKDYTYSRAEATMTYRLPTSDARLELWGDNGHRALNLHWKQDPNEPPLPDFGD